MISFIILHYKNIEETLECLKDIKKISLGFTTSIIVVDNNSLTNNEENILKKYTEDVIKLEKNYGFAKANNIGIKYAQNKYHPDYYCVINNDVFITQTDFINKIQETYKTYKFDMLGPKILSPSHESVNPFPVLKTKVQIENEIKRCQKLIKIYENPILYSILLIYLNLKHFFNPPSQNKNGTRILQNVALHGCAIIFSKKYIKKYRYPFYNETFLFHEEEFLYKRIKKDKLISIYNPELIVFHKEGSSIKKERKGSRTSKLFKERERLKSLNLLLEIEE